MKEKPRSLSLLREALAKKKAAQSEARTLPLPEKFDRFQPNTVEGEVPGGRREEFTGLKARISSAFVRGVEHLFDQGFDALERKMKERGEWDAYVEKQRAEREAILSDPTPIKDMAENEYENLYEAAAKSVDQKALKDLMTEHYLRAGASLTDMNFVKAFNIRVYKPSEKGLPSPNPGSSMFYDGTSNSIGVNVRKPQLNTIKLNNPLLDTPWGLRSVTPEAHEYETGEYAVDYPEKPLLTAYVTRGVIHEAYHSTSAMRVDNAGPQAEFRDEHTVSEMFDEAVTDMEADETFLDYARSYGIPGVSSDDARGLVDLSNYLGIEGRGLLSPYATQKFFLDCTIEAFADKFGVPPDVVKHGMMRAQMRGISGERDEQGRSKIQQEIREAFNEGFRELEIARQVIEGMSAASRGRQNFNTVELFRQLNPEAKDRLLKKYFTLPNTIPLSKEGGDERKAA